MINAIFAGFYLIFFILYLYNVFFNDNYMTFELWLMSIIYLVPYSYDLLKLRKSRVDYESLDGTEKFTEINTIKSLKIIHQPTLIIIMVIVSLIVSFIV